MTGHHTTPPRLLLALGATAVLAVTGCSRAGEDDAQRTQTGQADAPAVQEQGPSPQQQEAAEQERERQTAFADGRAAVQRDDWDAVGDALDGLDPARDATLRREARARLARVVQPLIDDERYVSARSELGDGREAFGLRDAPVEQLKLVRREIAAQRRRERVAEARRERREDRQRRAASTAKRGLRSGGRQSSEDLCSQVDETDFAVPPGDPRDADGDGIGCES